MGIIIRNFLEAIMGRKKSRGKDIVAALEQGVAWAKGEIDLKTSVPTDHLSREQKLAAAMDFGFVIYSTPHSGPFAITKVRTPKAPGDMPDSLERRGYSSFEEALDAVMRALPEMDPRMERSWSALMGFNRGLGQETRNLGIIKSPSVPQAKVKAEALARKLIQTDKDLRDLPNLRYEVRIRPVEEPQ